MFHLEENNTSEKLKYIQVTERLSEDYVTSWTSGTAQEYREDRHNFWNALYIVLRD